MRTALPTGQKEASFEHAAIVIALRHMFNTKTYFDVCSLDAALQTAAIHITDEQKAPFRALHCIHYANMPPGFKEQLAARVLELFVLPPDFKIDVQPAQIVEPKRGLIQRLLSSNP